MSTVAVQTEERATGSNGMPPAAAAQELRLPFTPEEAAAFHAEDRFAARGVVGIMLTIFTAALLGYTFICLWAAWGEL